MATIYIRIVYYILKGEVYMYEGKITFDVRYAETDQMGIVYHSNYYIWFDMGRTDFLRKYVMDYCEVEDDGLMFPILEAHCYYKKPARFGDVITVHTKLSELKGVRIIFSYEVYNKNEELLANGYTVQASVSKEMKPVNIKKDYKYLYDKLSAAAMQK